MIAIAHVHCIFPRYLVPVVKEGNFPGKCAVHGDSALILNNIKFMSSALLI